MAYTLNTTNLRRRRALATFFVGSAAYIAGRVEETAALSSSQSYPDADAQLLAHWREYVRSEIELNAAQDARDLISWNARQVYPPKPDCIASGVPMIPTETDIDIDIELMATTTDMNLGPQPAAERMAEIEAWLQTCRDINIRFGVPALEAAFKAAWDRQWAAFARFVETPAITLAGLAVKTSAILYFEVGTRRAWGGTVADGKELEPEQQILLTLRRDLLHMA